MMWMKEGVERIQQIESWLAVTRGATRLAAWIFIFLIIWTQLFYCKYFFFFTKIRDFFSSINKDLDNLIWTERKKTSFLLS